MKIPDELREKLQAETKANIEDKLSRLRKRTAHNVFLEDKSIPTREHAYYKEQVLLGIQLYEDLLPGIKKVLGNIKKNYVPEIWEQNAITAVYLLSAKTFTNLQTIIHLAKHGRNFEIMDLARSGMESLDLAFLFLEKGQDARISNWFEGKIIDNDKAREAFHKAINAEKISVEVLPVYEMKTQVYRIYSHYSHSAYSAILELINLFSENYDFEDISGYYYTNKNLSLIHI